MDTNYIASELLATAKLVTGIRGNPSITGDKAVDRNIFLALEDAVDDLIQDAANDGRTAIDKSAARRAIRDIARKNGADSKKVEHYFWEQYHDTDWPER